MRKCFVTVFVLLLMFVFPGMALAGTPEPTISPPGGTFTGSQTITIYNPSGSSTYYTTDGSNPESSNTRTKISGEGQELTVSQSETILAISHRFLSGWSIMVEADFNISPPVTQSPAPIINPPIAQPSQDGSYTSTTQNGSIQSNESPASNTALNPTYLYSIGFILFIVIVVLILVAVNKPKPVVNEEDEEITRYVNVREPDYVVSSHLTGDQCPCGGKSIIKVFRSGETEKQCIECSSVFG